MPFASGGSKIYTSKQFTLILNLKGFFLAPFNGVIIICEETGINRTLKL